MDCDNINIILVSKHTDSIIDMLEVLTLIEQLNDTYSFNVYGWVESELLSAQWQYISANPYNLIISFGGDGTMIYSMKLAATYNCHVVGVNHGHLGFLTSYEGSDVYQICDIVSNYINAIADGTYQQLLDERYYLHINSLSSPHKAINEVLIASSDRNIPLQVDTYINGTFAMSNKGDGVMVSTATGSTAYALSAGGSIMDSNSKSMQIVPLASHSLSSRPIIVDSDKRVMLMIPKEQRSTAIDIIVDGMTVDSVKLNHDVAIRTTIAKTPVSIIKKLDWDFYYTLKQKLNW